MFDELRFCIINLDRLNFKPFVPKSSTVEIIYSDDSSTGFGGHFSVQCGRYWSFGSFTNKEKATSSTMRELLALKYVLNYSIDMIANYPVKWFTDNKNVVQIIKCGSRDPELQGQALEIFNICLSGRISIEMKWIPRTDNEQADTISRIQDPDDLGISFKTFMKWNAVGSSHHQSLC